MRITAVLLPDGKGDGWDGGASGPACDQESTGPLGTKAFWELPLPKSRQNPAITPDNFGKNRFKDMGEPPGLL